MHISGFTRINTQIRPGAELAVIHLNDGDGDGIPCENIRATVSEIKDSISGIAVDSCGSDPLLCSDLYVILKGLSVPHVGLMLMTQGSDPVNLDDVVGAGYVEFLDLEINSPISESQMRCIDVMRDNGCHYMVTITVSKDSFDEDSLHRTVMQMRDARHVVIRNIRDKNALTQKELTELTKPLKGLVRDLKIV